MMKRRQMAPTLHDHIVDTQEHGIARTAGTPKHTTMIEEDCVMNYVMANDRHCRYDTLMMMDPVSCRYLV